MEPYRLGKVVGKYLILEIFSFFGYPDQVMR
jgi:hypothetical protein